MSDLFFAKKSPTGSSTPEELDHLMVVVRIGWWVPLASLVFLCIVTLIWSIWGRIPISVNGVGVIINPGNVKTVQAEGSGVVESLHVTPGQEVRPGDLIATLSQLLQEQSARQARENYEEIRASNTRSLEINARRFAEHMKSLDRQRELLYEGQRLSQSVHEATRKRYEAVLELANDGLANKDALLSAESALVESQTKMANYDVQVQQLELEREQARQQNIQTEFQLTSQIDDSRRSMERLNLQLENARYIRATVPGRVLEVMTSIGRLVNYGTEMVSIETSQEPENVRNLCFFSVKDGKRLQDGLRVLATPTTVKRERFGGIVGEVVSVSAFPISREAAINIIGSEELAGALMSQGAMIQVEVDLKRSEDPENISGFQWSSENPPVSVNQGMVTMNRIAIEQRAPITYVMPLLRSWFQGQKDDFLPGI